ncbi:hypothetical protein BC936DRAFT_140727 [Jimgerdemannia flammicorona]|uniref:Uncharacterized protein n=1 Tax=Jimgerdemannia flammicorona TaxID=994334 RepID=A0A433ACX7_9FUNG|nr:hypothetical protein BC936DRAFT_140727 [Jimgerdemannia flammicorona]
MPTTNPPSTTATAGSSSNTSPSFPLPTPSSSVKVTALVDTANQLLIDYGSSEDDDDVFVDDEDDEDDEEERRGGRMEGAEEREERMSQQPALESLSPEHGVHLLERDLFGFRDEDPDGEEGGKPAPNEEEDAAGADSGDRVRADLDAHLLEGPVDEPAQRLGLGADRDGTRGEQLDALLLDADLVEYFGGEVVDLWLGFRRIVSVLYEWSLAFQMNRLLNHSIQATTMCMVTTLLAGRESEANQLINRRGTFCGWKTADHELFTKSSISFHSSAISESLMSVWRILAMLYGLPRCDP